MFGSCLLRAFQIAGGLQNKYVGLNLAMGEKSLIVAARAPKNGLALWTGVNALTT